MTPKAGSISSMKQLGKQSDWWFIKIRFNFMTMTLNVILQKVTNLKLFLYFIKCYNDNVTTYSRISRFNADYRQIKFHFENWPIVTREFYLGI